MSSVLNSLTPKISSVILLTVYHTVLVMFDIESTYNPTRYFSLFSSLMGVKGFTTISCHKDEFDSNEMSVVHWNFISFGGKIEHYRVRYTDDNRLTVDDEIFFENLTKLVEVCDA